MVYYNYQPLYSIGVKILKDFSASLSDVDEFRIIIVAFFWCQKQVKVQSRMPNILPS